MNLNLSKPLGIAAVSLCITVSFAAEPENPTRLSLAHVKPYTASFDYFVDDEDGNAERAGYWTDSLAMSDGYVIRTIERFDLDDQKDLARTVVAASDTLSPVRLQQRFGPQLSNLYQLEFSGQQITQILIGNAVTPARIANATLSQAVVETG